MSVSIIIFVFLFLLGFYFYVFYSNPKCTEGLINNITDRCPNILIQKGAKIYLYNSKLAEVPGVNPIEFNNLEDYSEFLDWQRSQGIRCPVLFLQESNDAQGNNVFKVRPSITDPQAGLPPTNTNTNIISNQLAYPNPTLLVDATRNDKPYNMGSVAGYDNSSFYVGSTTPLDVMDIKQEKAEKSPNPMDANWGGANFTQKLIDQGYYKDNEVAIRV